MRWIIGLLFGLGCATLVASPLDGWLLPGEDVRRVGALPAGVVCAASRTAARYRQGTGPFKPFMTPGLYPGERWDDWANDQDWSLYYAVRYLCREI